jgi:hypothetical protein
MSYPTSLTDTELSAVNQILGAVGQAPIQTLDQTNPDVDIAYTTLIDVSRSVQAEGWNFNTENEYPLTPDTSGFIYVTSSMLGIDLSDLPENRGYQVTQRDGKLYNKTDHTFVWPTTKSYKCDIVWLIDFASCPQVFQDYIVAKASVLASIKMIGDKDQYLLLQDREKSTRACLLEADCNQANYSMLGYSTGEDYYYSYQPFQTLAR